MNRLVYYGVIPTGAIRDSALVANASREVTLEIDWKSAMDTCDELGQKKSLAYEIFSQLSERWRLRTMGVLAAEGGPLRFSRIMERVGRVSQKSLTKSLRDLERDGFVTRTVFPEVPPRVEYTITALGLTMLEQIHPYWLWVVKNRDKFEKARRKHDRTGASTPAS